MPCHDYHNDYHYGQQLSRCDCHSCTQARHPDPFGIRANYAAFLQGVQATPPALTTVEALLALPNSTESARARISVGIELIEKATDKKVTGLALEAIT